MANRLIAAVAGLCLCSTAHAQFKCTGADGKVTFQQAPCQSAEQRQESVKLRENVIGGSAATLGVEPLNFGPARAPNLTIAAAALEVLETSGQDCQIKLKVRPDTRQAEDSCHRYLAQHRQWFKAAITEVQKGATEDYSQHERTIARAVKDMERVNQLHQFITLTLRNR